MKVSPALVTTSPLACISMPLSVPGLGAAGTRRLVRRWRDEPQPPPAPRRRDAAPGSASRPATSPTAAPSSPRSAPGRPIARRWPGNSRDTAPSSTGTGTGPRKAKSASTCLRLPRQNRHPDRRRHHPLEHARLTRANTGNGRLIGVCPRQTWLRVSGAHNRYFARGRAARRSDSPASDGDRSG
jgi:hypothetical protein